MYRDRILSHELRMAATETVYNHLRFLSEGPGALHKGGCEHEREMGGGVSTNETVYNHLRPFSERAA